MTTINLKDFYYWYIVFAQLERESIQMRVQEAFYSRCTKGYYEDYSRIIYDLKDKYKELIYYLYIRDYTTLFVGNLLRQTDRNIRGVRSTILGQIAKKVIAVLLERQEFDISLWVAEQMFLKRHEKEIPKIRQKSEKEKEKLIREIGVLARKLINQYQKNITVQNQ